MDIKLIQLKKSKKTNQFISKLEQPDIYTKEEKIKILEQHFSFLGLQLIETNYCLVKDTNQIVDALLLDEDYRLVVVEYRFGKWGRTIQNGLLYLDYIKEHISQFKLLIGDKFGKDVINQVTYKPRLLIIADTFHLFDAIAIQKMPYLIETISFHFIGSHLIFEKHFQSKNIDYIYNSSNIKKENENLYQELRDTLLGLGEEVVETNFGYYASYRKIKPFLVVTFDDDLTIHLKKDKYIIHSSEDIEKILPFMEEAYDAE